MRLHERPIQRPTRTVNIVNGDESVVACPGMLDLSHYSTNSTIFPTRVKQLIDCFGEASF